MKVMGDILTVLVFIYFIVALYGLVRGGFAPYDNTDNQETKERSSMHLYTDYGTGNQYLGTVFSGLVPRVDARGKQVNIYSNPIKER